MPFCSFSTLHSMFFFLLASQKHLCALVGQKCSFMRTVSALVLLCAHTGLSYSTYFHMQRLGERHVHTAGLNASPYVFVRAYSSVFLLLARTVYLMYFWQLCCYDIRVLHERQSINKLIIFLAYASLVKALCVKAGITYFIAAMCADIRSKT